MQPAKKSKANTRKRPGAKALHFRVREVRANGITPSWTRAAVLTDAQNKSFMKRELGRPSNQKCFRCENRNPTRCCVPMGVLLCSDCARWYYYNFTISIRFCIIERRRNGGGVMDDPWNEYEAALLEAGGNERMKMLWNWLGIGPVDSPASWKSPEAAQARAWLLGRARLPHRRRAGYAAKAPVCQGFADHEAKALTGSHELTSALAGV